MKLIAIALAIFVAVSGMLAPGPGTAPAQAPKPAKAFALTKRVESGPYGTSAFSFRSASQDVATHRNNVDLVYSNCGLLHFNAVAGMASRATDLGKGTLDGTPNAADAKAAWNADSVPPEEGHVYLLEINARGKRSVVKFRVDRAKDDALDVSWAAVNLDPPPAADPRQGTSGTKGLCGGNHPPK